MFSSQEIKKSNKITLKKLIEGINEDKSRN